MPLPKIDLPIYEVKLVSIATPIKFRPFLVKEEKLLLMALQTDEEEAVLSAIKQVVNNCLVEDTSSFLDIDKLPIFDLEYLFLNIRARSVGEEVETFYLCRNKINAKDEEGNDAEVDCAHMMPIKVNILDVKPPIDDLPSKIMITDKIGIKLKYPTLKSFSPIKNMVASEDDEGVFNMIYECSEYVYDADGLYYTKESSKEEFNNFLDSLTQEQYDRIIAFFENLPEIKHDVVHTCEKCGFVHAIHLEGLNDFFILTVRNSNLKTYYNNMFTMVHQYKYTLTELENMMPWERDLYINMLNVWVREEEDKIKNNQMIQEQNYRNMLSKIKKRR